MTPSTRPAAVLALFAAAAVVAAGQDTDPPAAGPGYKFEKKFTQVWTTTAAGKVTLPPAAEGGKAEEKTFENQVTLTLAWGVGTETKAEAGKKATVSVPVTVEAVAIKAKSGADDLDTAAVAAALGKVAKKTLTVVFERGDKGAIAVTEVKGLADAVKGLGDGEKRVVGGVLTDALLTRQMALAFPALPGEKDDAVTTVPGGKTDLKLTLKPAAKDVPNEYAASASGKGEGKVVVDPALGQLKTMTLTFDGTKDAREVAVPGGKAKVSQTYTVKLETKADGK